MIDCFPAAEWAFFCFLKALVLLAGARKLTGWMIFTATKKGATPERRLKKNVEPLTLGATE
ncbi:hypothetical protein [Pseudomonas brassicacearum]|uniref:hypothetical protein n=1 Tax=Pseudomonas brassicacearum TaxID=930166 RepID=UPI0011CDA93C|nr:hypothetical protein [Pseudomonas brassicacearum]